MPLINFSGLASGIDSEALIEATTEATRQQRIVPNEEEISELEDENDALGEVKTLLDELKDIVGDYTTLNGGVVAKQVNSTDETIVSAIASDAAVNGTYDVTVTQIATNSTISFGARGTATSDVIDATYTGSFDITTGSETVTIDPVDWTSYTYSDFITEFNSESTNATASLVNVAAPTATPSYAIVISSDSVGQTNGLISLDYASLVGAATTLRDTDPAYSADLATNAQLSLAGISTTIERDSNTINDLISGVTLSLNKADTGTNVTLTVGVDSSTTESNIETFIEKYNELVSYINENNEISREENGDEVENIFGSLANTRVDDNALTGIRNAFTSSTYDQGTQVRIFADFGIVTERDGTLSFAKTAADSSLGFAFFEEAIAAEPDSINEVFKLFADELATTGGAIDQYTRFNGLIDNTTSSNTERISDLNDRIARAEDAIASNEQSLRARFARLESLTSQLQSQQQALTSALASLGG